MKIKIAFVAVIIIFALSCENELTAEKIIQKSIEEAHGGKENWEKIKGIRYKKTTTLYDSLGNLERIKKQTFHNTLQPKFTSKVTWKEGNVEKEIVFDGEQTSVFIDGNAITDTKAIEAAYKEIMGAHFVLWQPYKLLTDEVQLTLEGKTYLEDGSEVYKIKAIYPDSNAYWWYYVDTHTWLLRENLVKHGATYSQIQNLAQEHHTGFRLHQKRASYTIDSVRNQKYLRASYLYEINELK